MPLPTTDQVWPPTPNLVQQSLADWGAWYSSDPHLLYERYANRPARDIPPTVNKPSQFRTGVWGKVARWFWGNPVPPGEKVAKLHIPLAGDIARTSSDLLFSEPPTLLLEDATSATQQALDGLVDAGLHATLLEAAEVCSGLGGTYLRIVWDEEIQDQPWIDSVAADGAVPEFSYNRLRAVTFWRVVHREGLTWWRHLERHERGVIYHGLYQGSSSQLGRAVPLTEQPETAPLADQVDAEGAIDTGAPDHLTAAYVPNVRPARGWRHIPEAAGWGQSDYQGIEGIMDALDETYTSWMRDIRLAKGRIIIPQSMLESIGPGQGAAWSEDREVYAGLNMMQRPGDSGQLTLNQFAIRHAEHRETAQELIEQAVRQAGYSGATFGLSQDGNSITATEVRARERRSMTTRARKALYWGPALADITAAWLAVCAGPLFGVDGITVEEPDVEFRDSIADSPQELAQTAALLATAEAASTETRVRMIHPDWDEDQIAAEVALIHADFPPPLANPDAVHPGLDGPPPGQQDEPQQ